MTEPLQLTWNKIKEHTSVKDRWIVVENKVYDVSRWQNRHPGGRKIIGHFQGQDATEAFRAFHKDLAQVHKYLKPLYMGELDVSNLTDEERAEAQKRAAYVEDMANLRQKMEELDLFRSSLFFFAGLFAQIVFFEVLAYCNLCWFGTGWFPLILSILFYTIVQGQASWLQHDLGHLSVFKSTRVNHVFHEVLLGFIKGASCHWWNNMHSQHHAKPNVIDKDPDIRLEPMFVIGDSMPVRAASEQGPWKWHMPYSYQDIYFFFIGPPLLFPVYFQFMSFRHIFLKKRWEDLAWVTGFFAKLFVLYYPLLGFWGTLGYFLTVRILESIWFTWVSQSNHIPMEVTYDRSEAWLPLQNRATCNIEQSLFNDWFTGHLNFQLEHHLFPTMPRHNLVKAQPYVMELCQKHQLDYPVKPLGGAFVDIIRSLRRAANVWMKARSANKSI